MTRLNWPALTLALVTIVIFWAPIFHDYGIAAGLGWLAITIGFLAVLIWAAGSSTKDPRP